MHLVLLRTPTPEHLRVGPPIKSNILVFSVDTGCRVQGLPRAIIDRDAWREIERERQRERESKESMLSIYHDIDDDVDFSHFLCY